MTVDAYAIVDGVEQAIEHETDATITVSVEAKSKSFRMYSEEFLRDAAGLALDDPPESWPVYHQQGSVRYHVIIGWYVLIVAHDADGNEAAVVTQSHQHVDYPHDDRFERVDRVGDVGGDVDG